MCCKVKASLLDEYLSSLHNEAVTIMYPCTKDNTAQANRNSRRNPIFHLCATHRQCIDKGCPPVPIPSLSCFWFNLMGWYWWKSYFFPHLGVSPVNCRAVCKLPSLRGTYLYLSLLYFTPLVPVSAALKDQNKACSSLWMSAYLRVRLSIVWLSRTIKWEETITRVVTGVMNLMFRFNKNRL